MSPGCLESDELSSHSAKKCSTCSVVRLGKQISCAICCKSFSEKNDFVFSNDEWSILKVSLSLVGFDNTRLRPWGHLRPVRKYARLSKSFKTSAASLRVFKPSSKLGWTLSKICPQWTWGFPRELFVNSVHEEWCYFKWQPLTNYRLSSFIVALTRECPMN